MKITKDFFGKLPNGDEVTKYRLINDNNIAVSILNYGGIITEIITPDKNGHCENIVLGFDDIDGYMDHPQYYGCIIGRTAGRISNARFKINDVEYSLSTNDGNNNLHGGVNGFDKVIWDVKEISKSEGVGLELYYLSPDNKEGFPGNAAVTVTYFLSDKNELSIDYKAISDQKTIFNMTNHTYFNLSGGLKSDILNHHLTINSNKVIHVDEEIIPTGHIQSVDNTIFDFRSSKNIGGDINTSNEQLNFCGGYDHPFILDKSCGYSAVLEDNTSGRMVKVSTDQPVLVFYSGNMIDNSILFSGKTPAKKHLGLCLETQDFPDGINQSNFPSVIYGPGEAYKARTTFSFCLQSDKM